MALMSELTLPPPENMFKWQVSVVQQPAPPETVAPSPPVEPAPPVSQPIAKPTPRKPEPVKQQPIEKPMQTARAVTPVQETQPVESVQPIQEVQQLRDTQPVQEARLEQAVQPVQQTTESQATAVTRPVQNEAQSREVTQSVSRSEAPVETAESVEQALSTASEPTVQQLVTARAGPVQAQPITPIAPVTERGFVEDSQAPVETAQKIEQPVTARNAPVVQQRTVQHVPLQARPAARPDYGWLAQALWATVDQRKRYPLEAKLNRWEGKVILRLTIEQRGTTMHLLDLALEESSGHTVLDRHTQDIVRKAFPLEVKHALSQPRIQLHVPFSYSIQ